MKGKLIPIRRVSGKPHEMSDEALVAACATGESAALGALFDRYHDRVVRFIASRARAVSDTDIDDLAQQTFIEVGRAAARFSERSAVSTWLFGIANNIVRHHDRSEGRRRRLADAASAEGARRGEASGGGIDDAERRRALASAIEALPDKLREAFTLVYLEGIKGVDAATVIGCREGTLYKRLHQARAALRDALADFTGDMR